MRTATKVLLGVTVGAVALATTAAVVCAPRILPASGAIPGLRIGGATLTRGEDISTHVAARARAIESRKVRLRIRADRELVIERSLGELGVRVERAEVTRRAQAVGRRGHLAVRIDELARARRGEIDVPLTTHIDPERLAAVLLPLKEDTDRPARAARFDLETGAIIAHEPGHYLDLDAAITELERATMLAQADIVAPRLPIAPRVDAAMLHGTRIDVVLAQFVTHFAPDPNRGKNIEVAASRLDGIVLAPGELVSFNEVVGARSEENGFRRAPEIYKGEMVQGVGGGTCQVSSTFHAAAMHAGFDIVERYPHSRPSGYIGLGMDSTVSWPTVDLKLKNPFSFPVVVDTRVERGKLHVQLLGREKPATVALRSDTLAVIPFKRKVTESTWLEPGKVVQKQKGIRGYSVKKTRTIVLADGTQRVETTIDHYPPTPEHLVVAPGTEEADLPPLPEGAAGSDGEHAASTETAAPATPASSG